MKLTPKEKARRYYTVVDYQGEPISYHRSRAAAKVAIAHHISWDNEFNEQAASDYRINEPSID